MDNLTRDIDIKKNKISERQAVLDKCKSKFGFLGFLCDIAGEIVGLKGDLRKLSEERDATGIKAASLQKNLEDAENRQKQAVEQAEKRLQTIKIPSIENKRCIAEVEAEIKVIKDSLSEIRKIKQDFSVKIGEFQDAFAEFEGLDASSDRSSVVRRLRREDADLVDLLVKARKLLKNDLKLPSGERICAN